MARSWWLALLLSVGPASAPANQRCADGKAQCTSPVGCESPQPLCDGPYVPSFTNFCYQGCVLKTECS